MARITEARFDLVANDRTQAAFASVESSFKSIRRASQLFGMVIGVNLIGNIKRSVDEIMRLSDAGLNIIDADEIERLGEAQKKLEALKLTAQSYMASMAAYAVAEDSWLSKWWAGHNEFWEKIGAASYDLFSGAGLNAAAETFESHDATGQMSRFAQIEEALEAQKEKEKELEAQKARDAVASRETSAFERVNDILRKRLPLSEQINELTEDLGKMYGEMAGDEENRYQWLLKALQIEEEIRGLREKATSAVPAEKEDEVRGSFGSFADVNRRAQEFALKKQEARDEKRNKYLEEIAANTGEMAVFG